MQRLSTRWALRILPIDRFYVDPRVNSCEQGLSHVMGYVVANHHCSLAQLHHESVLVKPVNTPITPLCSKLDSAAHLAPLGPQR